MSVASDRIARPAPLALTPDLIKFAESLNILNTHGTGLLEALQCAHTYLQGDGSDIFAKNFAENVGSNNSSPSVGASAYATLKGGSGFEKPKLLSDKTYDQLVKTMIKKFPDPGDMSKVNLQLI